MRLSTAAVLLLSTLAVAWDKPRNYTAARAQFLPNAIGLGSWDHCLNYCARAINAATNPCKLNVSRLSTEPITPENAQLPVFDPGCWCNNSTLILEYTPRCIMCLQLFGIAPSTSELLAAVFELCLAPPLSKLPCVESCGDLNTHIAGVVEPCLAAAGTESEARACLCRQTVQYRVDDCQFCLLGWDQALYDRIGAIMAGCNDSVSKDRVTSFNSTTLDPTGASGHKRSAFALGDLSQGILESIGPTAGPAASEASPTTGAAAMEPGKSTVVVTPTETPQPRTLPRTPPLPCTTQPLDAAAVREAAIREYEHVTVIVGGIVCVMVFVIGYAEHRIIRRQLEALF
ncbi:MAG: hypothetical protein M1832_004370 [Thelocarpon impressellum]|nr:MAG: hypothetical protein M1832_004370 [Thelocarpon impressellum]